MIFAIVLLLQGFVNVYYKNYNGGPESSSGSIKYYLIGAVAVFLVASLLYAFDKHTLAALTMCMPIACTLGFLVVRIFVPVLMGERFN
jgi:hypothetical protein